MFKWFSKKCGQKHEIMDDNIHTFWKIVWTFESTYEHSSERRKCGQLLFKFGQYYPYFLENSMNIQVNPENVDSYSLSLDNIVHIFWKIVWTFESTHEHSS